MAVLHCLSFVLLFASSACAPGTVEGPPREPGGTLPTDPDAPGGPAVPTLPTVDEPADGAVAPARDAGGPPASPYPSGPYGLREGDTIRDLSFTRPDGSSLTLGELRRDTVVRAILWISGAGWCSSCIEEVPRLIRLHERYANAGLHIVESLYQDDDYRQASPAFAGEWQRYFRCPYDVVAEPEPGYGEADAIPQSWLIDAETMRIVRFAFDTDDIERRIESTLGRSRR